MSQLERQQQILDLLSSLPQNNSLSIVEIAASVYASESSVRRDVRVLEKRGLLTHIYGGVMITAYRNTIVPLTIRDSINSEIKEFLASSAAAMVNDGDIIFLDSSSTARRIPFYLRGKKALTVITNNQRIFTEYAESDIAFYSVGGRFNPVNANLLGSDAVSYILEKNADIAFFSSQGLSLSGDITDISEEETAVRKAMIKKAKKQVFLCDSSKIGIEKFTTLCNIKDISDVICDKPDIINTIKER